MTPEELSKLKQGDVVRHEETGAGYIVLSNRAGVPTVVRSIELHNGREWSHVYTPTPVTTAPAPSIVDMVLDLEGRGWTFRDDLCARWTTPDGYYFYSLRVAYAHRGCHPTRADLATKKRLEALATEIPAPSLTVKWPAPLPTTPAMIRDLYDAGWKQIGYDKWTDPAGETYRGPAGAWRRMHNRKLDAVTAASARPPVKSFAEARAVLVSAGWKNICGKVWKSPSGALVEGTLAAYKIVTRPADTTGDCNAS